MKPKSSQNPAIANLDLLAKLMDSQFKIPGTNLKFGLDPLIGLLPGVGDFVTFLISGYMVMTLARNGASGFVLARMTLNILIDALIGSVPILGDIFDFSFKANQRNMKLMHEHYVEERHNGGAWKLILPILFIVLLFVGALGWLGYKMFNWLIHYNY